MHERRRPGAFGGAGTHTRDAAHLEGCPDCRGALESERRYLAALRGAPVPMASSSLTQRLVEQTRQLALEAELSEAESPRARMLRAAGVAVAGAAAALAALAVTAYAVAGDPLPAAPTAAWPAAVGIDGTGQTLSAADLQALSAAGWNCPELRRNGLQVESARGYLVNGVPTLVIRIGDGSHTISLMEQLPRNAGGAAPQTTVLASDFPNAETADLVRGAPPAGTMQAAESPVDRLARGLHLVLNASGRP
ncbi:hypothetical protein [Sinomonas sp. P47F7]|uniref:hypothetical protein n=1 Tax=Sinomonas sp. P47F7 TaxID=3410987 RepID=UPI003BF4C8A1